MENDRDILGKADALLRRHAPARPEHGEGADVPVLTELITPGGPLPTAPATLAARATATRLAAHRGAASAAPRRRLHARADRRGRRMPCSRGWRSDLEHRLTQQVMAEVHASVAATLGDLRQDIANAVRRRGGRGARAPPSPIDHPIHGTREKLRPPRHRGALVPLLGIPRLLQGRLRRRRAPRTPSSCRRPT